MKYFLLTFLICSSAFAWVFPCNNYAQRDEVEWQYQRCINTTFSDFAKLININFTPCRTFGGSDNVQYIDCINRNFNRVEPYFRVSIRNCFNWSYGSPQNRYQLTREFQSCVNQNFRQVDYLIRTNP